MNAAPLLVLDASAAVSFVAKEELSGHIKNILGSWRADGRVIVVPPFFWLEVVNALLGRRRWTGAQVLEAVAELDGFELETVPQDRALVVLTIDLAERHRIIAYDAAYLSLAIQLDAQLLTVDRRLAAAAGARSVPVGAEHRLSEAPSAYERDVTWPDYRGASAYLANLRAEILRQ